MTATMGSMIQDTRNVENVKPFLAPSHDGRGRVCTEFEILIGFMPAGSDKPAQKCPAPLRYTYASRRDDDTLINESVLLQS
jgi:hypothetical protein